MMMMALKRIYTSLEQHFEVDMAYVLKNGGWTLLGQSVSAIAILASTAILAHLMSKESFGMYRFVLALVPLLILPSLTGMPTALTRAIACGASINIRYLARIRITWGLIGSVLALMFVGYYTVQQNTPMVVAFLIATLFIPFQESFLLYPAYLKGKHDFKHASFYETAGRIAQALMLIIIALVTTNTTVIILVYFIGIAVTRYLLFAYTFRNLCGGNINETKEVILHSKELTIVTIVATLMSNIDKIIVWHYFGAEALAVYTVAQTIPVLVIAFMDGFVQIALPRFSIIKWTKNTITVFLKSVLKLTMISAVLTSLLITTLPYIMSTAFPTYEVSATFMAQIFSLLLLCIPVNALFDQMMMSQRKSFFITVVTTIGLFLFIGISALLGPIFGLVGIVYAYVIKEFAVLLLRIINQLSHAK